MNAQRFRENPIITPADVSPSRDDFEVVGVFNPGAVKFGDEILLLVRVAERPRNHDASVVSVPALRCETETAALEVHRFMKENPEFDFSDPRVVAAPGRVYLTSISHLRIARSRDGIHFTVDDRPAMIPDRASEAYGIEDARITEIDGTYYIVYKSVAPNGITQSLATTRDFETFEKHGVIFPPENMDAMIFPEKIHGRYAALHRPVPHTIGQMDMWVAYSDDAWHWGEHRYLAGVMPGGWENGRVGGGAVPFMTECGWMEIYHGATLDNRYSLGAMLLDPERPERVTGRTAHPILEPEEPYELSGFMPNVVFSSGAIVDDDRLTIYYGAADMVIAAAEMSVTDILQVMEV